MHSLPPRQVSAQGSDAARGAGLGGTRGLGRTRGPPELRALPCPGVGNMDKRDQPDTLAAHGGWGLGGSWLGGVLLEEERAKGGESSTKSPLAAQPAGWAWDLLSSAGLHVRKLIPPSQPLRLQPPSPGSGRRGGLGMPPPGTLRSLPVGAGQGEEGSGGLLRVRAPSVGS